jgi:hypothetical protein
MPGERDGIEAELELEAACEEDSRHRETEPQSVGLVQGAAIYRSSSSSSSRVRSQCSKAPMQASGLPSFGGEGVRRSG